MQRLNKFFLAFSLTVMGPMAQARDGWSTGGGELVMDAHNPWFLYNTPIVKYCVVVGQDFENIESERLHELFQSAVSYWHEKLEKAEPFQKFRQRDNTRLGYGGKTFQRAGCNEKPHLTLQFGVLDSEQLSKIGDPTRFAGITVRTKYNPETLQGSGFIYISPDHGPRAFRGPSTVANTWTIGNNNLLRLLLIHELGHVYGIQHAIISQDQGANLMSEDFAERILSERSYKRFLEINKPDFLIPDLDGASGNRFYCMFPQLQASAINYFVIDPKDGPCLRFAYNEQKFYVWQFRSDNASYHSAGTMIPNVAPSKWPTSNEIIADLYVTPAQKVLPYRVDYPVKFPMLESVTFKVAGNYLGGNASVGKPFLMSIRPTGLTITGYVDREIHESVIGWMAFN